MFRLERLNRRQQFVWLGFRESQYVLRDVSSEDLVCESIVDPELPLNGPLELPEMVGRKGVRAEFALARLGARERSLAGRR